jgi:hypothetical protein
MHLLGYDIQVRKIIKEHTQDDVVKLARIIESLAWAKLDDTVDPAYYYNSHVKDRHTS